MLPTFRADRGDATDADRNRRAFLGSRDKLYQKKNVSDRGNSGGALLRTTFDQAYISSFFFHVGIITTQPTIFLNALEFVNCAYREGIPKNLWA